jgi:hypothetical protein
MKNIVRSIIGLLLGTILVSASAQDGPSIQGRAGDLCVLHQEPSHGRFDDYAAFLDSQFHRK